MSEEIVERLEYKTRDGGTSDGKTRVYFTCHVIDKDKYFEDICKDIFAIKDCTIYYTENMNASYSESILETDLERINLFVIPVTWALLKGDNRVIDVDLPFANKHHIPVLPLMMEEGLDEQFINVFGELQYISPNKYDETAISYEEKLKKYLEATLVGIEMRERIQAAFDAYIFLSYRKKDRKFANELMRLIHLNPLCRNIAIWYDEFLIPGENYNDAIKDKMKKSTLFMLLVTPHLLEEGNYVLTTEYPYAKENQKNIFPVEMETTDRDSLCDKYKGIPDCVIGEDNEEFRQLFIENLHQVALSENDNDPVHNFLIGLAYLEGIDVEVNREYAVELFQKAAIEDIPEAIDKLAQMYHDGLGVKRDWNKWFDLVKKSFILSKTDKDTEIDKLLKRGIAYADACNTLAKYEEALQQWQEVYDIQIKTLDKNDIDVMTTLGKMSIAYQNIGEIEKAKEINEDLYHTQSELLGEQRVELLLTMDRLAKNYFYLQEYGKAWELWSESVRGLREILGSSNPTTLIVRKHFYDMACFDKHYEYASDMYWNLHKEVSSLFGEDHPEALLLNAKYALCQGMMLNEIEAFRVANNIKPKLCEVLGENHPEVVEFEYYMGQILSTISYTNAAIVFKSVYEKRRVIFGENHPETQMALQAFKEMKEKEEHLANAFREENKKTDGDD